MIIINSILLAILIFIAAMILHSLLVSKDGTLRKIMIGYFTSEIIMLFGFLWLEIYYGSLMAKQTQTVLLAVLTPKTIVKVIFFNYITFNKK